MSRKQTSFFLVDYAKRNSLHLNPVAFDYDGSFFMDESEDAITLLLFGCKRDHQGCRTLLDYIRTSVGKSKELDASQSTEVHHLKIAL